MFRFGIPQSTKKIKYLLFPESDLRVLIRKSGVKCIFEHGVVPMQVFNVISNN